MKKTLHIDEELLRHAKVACHANTDTDTVRLGLEALVRHAAYERLRALRGADPRAVTCPAEGSIREAVGQRDGLGGYFGLDSVPCWP